MEPSDKSIVEVVKSQHVMILKVLLAIQALLLTWLLITAVGDGRYFPVHDDEVINFCSARLFKETASVRAESCINEDVSPIGQMNWYGPGYTLVYGTCQRLFGSSPALFIFLHFAFAVFSVVLVFYFEGQAGNKWMVANALLFSWPLTGYLYTYFPSALNILFSAILVYILLRINGETRPERKQYRIGLFVVAVLLFSLCRVTFIFWLAALIGLSESRKELIRYAILFTAGIILVLVYMKYFTAPPYAGEMQKIDRLYKLDILDFILKTGWAAIRNTGVLLLSKSIPVYFILVLIIINAVAWWKTRERLLLASLLVSVCLVGALMAYYAADAWYFPKQTDVLIVPLVTAIFLSGMPVRIKYGILGLSVVVFAFSYNEIRQSIDQRRWSYAHLEEYAAFRASLQEIRDKMNDDSPVTVLWCYTEYDFGNVTEALLPFSTSKKYPVMYTTNVVDKDAGPETKFLRHNKLKIDYLLSRSAVDWAELEEQHATEYYHFYKFK